MNIRKFPIMLVLCGPLLAAGCPADEDPADAPTAGASDGDEDDGSDEDDGEDDDDGETSGPDDPTEDPGTTTDEDPSTTEPEDETGGDPEDDEDEDDGETMLSNGFIGDMGNDVVLECSVWDQDCPAGEKCMPWANDGGVTWNATKCTPLDEAPGAPGDSCTVEGSGVSGIDSCQASAMCWNVDGETNEGTCLGFCAGSQESPVCDDPTTTCSITNDGVLILCLPDCDPLLQDCAEGEGCFGIQGGYVCAPDASGEMGTYGDPCEALNVCDPGLECSPAATVPGCTGSLGCCSPYCDTEAMDPCPGEAGGQECVPAFAENDAPPGYEDVGVCQIPA